MGENIGLGRFLEILGLEQNDTEYRIVILLLNLSISILPMVVGIYFQHSQRQWRQTHDCEYEGNLKKVYFNLSMMYLCLMFGYFNHIIQVFVSLCATTDIGDS